MHCELGLFRMFYNSFFLGSACATDSFINWPARMLAWKERFHIFYFLSRGNYRVLACKSSRAVETNQKVQIV